MHQRKTRGREPRCLSMQNLRIRHVHLCKQNILQPHVLCVFVNVQPISTWTSVQWWSSYQVSCIGVSDPCLRTSSMSTYSNILTTLLLLHPEFFCFLPSQVPFIHGHIN